MLNLSEPEVYIVKTGKFAGRKLTQLPAWMLKFMAKNHGSPSVRSGAADVLALRARMGIPPVKAKKPDNQKEIPLQDDRIAKKQAIPVSFLGSNAVPEGQDLF